MAQRHPTADPGGFLHQVERVIQAHLNDSNLNVSTLCRELGISRTPLHHRIKALSGKSTTEFVRFVRLSKARELLLSTDLTVREIAFRIGFRTPGYFSRKFREVHTVSPTMFRDINRTVPTD